MANSRIPGPLGNMLTHLTFGEDLPGIGRLLSSSLHRDSPGPLGFNDLADFVATRLGLSSGAAVSTSACACNRDLTLDELCAVYPHQKRERCRTFLPHLNATFRAYQINTCLRKAHFLAQVGHESGELRYVAEVLPKGKKEADVYDGYKGRGLIQTTYKRNYEAYGKAVKHDFTGDNRVDLEEPKWAADSAGYYWTTGAKADLNGLADNNDLLAITVRVNGGFNGFSDRASLLAAGIKHLHVRECKTVQVGKEAYLAFGRSAIYGEKAAAFAWGAWNDPASLKHGIRPQSETDRRAGYKRYIELREAENWNPKAKARYGFKLAKMDELAKAGVK